jgi:hypothetical protein
MDGFVNMRSRTRQIQWLWFCVYGMGQLHTKVIRCDCGTRPINARDERNQHRSLDQFVSVSLWIERTIPVAWSKQKVQE